MLASTMVVPLLGRSEARFGGGYQTEMSLSLVVTPCECGLGCFGPTKQPKASLGFSCSPSLLAFVGLVAFD
jgi:hypothetical protein